MTESDPLDDALQTAASLCDGGRFEDAIEVLKGFLRDHPDTTRRFLAGVHGKIGSIYLFELDRPLPAEEHFRESVRLSPRSELASLGLFHSLWGQGRTDEAFEEAKRLVRAAGPSQGYQRILAELDEARDPEGE